MRLLKLLFFCGIYSLAVGQTLKIESVYPKQDIIGASINTEIIVQLSDTVGNIEFPSFEIFRVFGSNSGIMSGSIMLDTQDNMLVFTPNSPFHCGEIINVMFGPISNELNDTISFNWRFSTESTNPTAANFDSLKRFEYPSYYPILIDYDNDGDVDIASGTGRVIYNDGYGNFDSFDEIEELIDLSFITDVNNDGNRDYVVSRNEYLGEICVLQLDSVGQVQEKQILYPYENITGLIKAVGDITGDGFVDLIAVEPYIGLEDWLWRVFVNDGTGKFMRSENASYQENYLTDADLTDMDKDGDLDLLILNTWPTDVTTQFEGVLIYYNDGEGTFADSQRIRFNLDPYDAYTSDLIQLFIIDYDLNGLNDIAAHGRLMGGSILMQETKYNFYGYVKSSFSGLGPVSFTSGDINGDRRYDMIITNNQVCAECGDTGDVKMQNYLNYEPMDFYSDTTTVLTDLGKRYEVGAIEIPITADVDNDGDIDIIHAGYPTTVTYNCDKITTVYENTRFPVKFTLHQNYPNPFNPTTQISYQIPNNEFVSLKVYNSLGQEVKTLVNEQQGVGHYDVEFDGSELSSGIYFYKLQAGEFVSVKKMILTK